MTAEPEIITFGCRLNSFESEVMRGHVREAGLGDAVVVNTCAVTAEAERQARQAIRRARRRRPGARIIVTGCAVQIDPGRYAAMPEVDGVLGNTEKLAAASFGPGGAAPFQVADIMTARQTATHVGPHMVEGLEGRARAFLQVQQGCDHRCSFCIIPFGRGPSRSVAPDQVIEQARRLVANGYGEIVLTGVDVTSYGGDEPAGPRLGGLVRKLLDALPELPRLRLTSLDPAALDEELMQGCLADPRLMPHFHLSLQSGDDVVLRRMKRRHSRADAVQLCADIRRHRPEAVFGADLIAGFPTESEAAFAATAALIEDCDLTYLHVFPYSARPGTAAARMPQLPAAICKQRAAVLRELGEVALAAYLRGRLGSRQRVLVEDGRSGRTESYAAVTLDRSDLSPGSIVETRVTGTDGKTLTAEVVT
ncbi:MAG TPA: tRNA (N(6)-L-threonylcarbamoyladenosine(37)-C(2))-methylthiotransferase MtaB [Alphaproteobacteria bacterium]|jgi:threonylcarbamoyladenosine tRNA methylthiotransferase MtaB|nr:tRNA (N(6)-L-threonylcarbamoyladenosine(37)-C(2))-methylthiotransferase MtaB [Alphaproteobacteria bacterium]